MTNFAHQKSINILKRIITIIRRGAKAMIALGLVGLAAGFFLMAAPSLAAPPSESETYATRAAETAVTAMMAARAEGDLDRALMIGADALLHNPQTPPSPRLIYELAHTLMLKGDCARAMPLFRYLQLDEVALDADRRKQAQDAMLLCPDEPQWQHHLTIAWAYDDNLGGVTPRRLITPEAGSSLDRVLRNIESSLQGVTLPDQLAIGQDPQSGQTLTVTPIWRRQWQDGHRVTSLQLRASARLTTPQGYEGYGVSAQINRHTAHGSYIRVQKTQLQWERSHQGEGKPPQESLDLSAFSGIEWPSARSVWIGTVLGQGRLDYTHDSPRTVHRSHYGLRAGLRGASHPSPSPQIWLKASAWSWSVQALSRRSSDPYAEQDEVYFSGESGAWMITPKHHMRLHLGYRWSRPHQTRPWLNARHSRHDYSLALVSSHLWPPHQKEHIEANAPHLRVMARYRWTQSKDALWPRQNVYLTIQYSY